MAVVAMWKCDRDDTMFDNKKDADAYDKMLELAENFTQLLEANAKSLSEQDAEQLGLLLAKNKEQLIVACKGKPEQLLTLGEGSSASDDNVTAIAAQG
jgi:hypothetical protein